MLDIQKKLSRLSRNISLLYVEDDDQTRDQFENIFKILFKEVQSAENGKVGLEYYKKKKYDLIITDLTMPLMDGVCMISEILEIYEAQHVIIMTAHNTSENLRNSIDFQVDGILLKPVAMDKLFQLLYKICHLIDVEKRDIVHTRENNRLDRVLSSENEALFLVVIDKYHEIIKNFGDEVKDYILSTVQEHLSYFGIDENSTIALHNDVLVCGSDKSYLDNILEALQDFSDAHNILIVEFNELKINITLSYGVIIIDNEQNGDARIAEYIHHINSVVDDIKEDEHSTFVVKMDVDIEEAKKSKALGWLGVTLDALKQNTVVPFYQPIIDSKTLEIVSYDIFSRIKEGDKYILPKFFIDLSEKAGILEDISKAVFKRGFEEFSKRTLSFHINLGKAELNNSAIKDYLVYLSSQYEVDHSRVIIDVSNHDSLKVSGKTMKMLLELKELGYKIALKDFGSGNINIGLITLLQPDFIKINYTLLEKAMVDSSTHSMLTFLLEYAKNDNIKSILTGIERENVLVDAQNMGFDYLQGYFIGRPSDKL